MFQRIIKYVYINFQFVFVITGFIWNFVNFNSPDYMVILAFISSLIFFPLITLLVFPYILGTIEYILTSNTYKENYREQFYLKSWSKNVSYKMLIAMFVLYIGIITIAGVIMAINTLSILFVQLISFLISIFGCILFVLLRNYLLSKHKDNNLIFNLLFLNPMIKNYEIKTP